MTDQTTDQAAIIAQQNERIRELEKEAAHWRARWRYSFDQTVELRSRVIDLEEDIDEILHEARACLEPQPDGSTGVDAKRLWRLIDDLIGEEP